MNEIYVVMQIWQDYGGSDSMPILVTPNLDKAEAKVEEMKAAQALRKVVYNTLQEHMKHWEVDNPRPRQVIDKQKKTKKDPLPLKEQFAEWARLRYNKQVEFTATFTQDEQSYLRDLNDDLIWEIETVPYKE